MNNLNKIKDSIDVVIYHDPCMDGFGAAYIAHRYNKDICRTVKLVPRKINSDPLDESIYSGKNVLMVDIVTNDYEVIKSKASNLIILDHHKTNQAKLAGKDYAYFDMHKSGIGLAWEFFHGEALMPLFLQCLQDRDLWTWKIPESKDFCDGLYNLLTTEEFDTYEQYINHKLLTFDDLYDEYFELHKGKFEHYCKMGAILDKIKMSKIRSIVRNASLFKMNFNDQTLKFCIFNAAHDIASDLGSYAVNNTDADFAVIWRYDHDEDEYYYSLRSIDTKADVSKICEKFGGGGHRNAAGCGSKLHPKELFQYEDIDEE
jgi:oligoribonuclease NrnB/cAMP/cGMP phosphodiesterase (DHH superfamily)